MTDDILSKMGPGTKMPPIEDDPEQVSVNVADLRALEAWTHGNTYPGPEIGHLIAAIPGLEWEPTDDTLLRLGHALASCQRHKESIIYVPELAEALHREGLIP